MSIDEAVADALRHNASAELTRNSLAAKREELRAAQRQNWPTLDAEFSLLHGRGEPTSFAAVNRQYDPNAPTTGPIEGNYGATILTFTVPIYQNGAFFFQNSPAAGAAEGRYTKTRSDGDAQAVDLANQAATSYIGALWASEEMSLQQQALERLQSRLEGVRHRVQARMDKRTDELTAEAALTGKKADLNAARRRYQLQQTQLSLARGLDPREQTVLKPLARELPALPALNDLVAAMLNTQPALRSQQADLSIAKAMREVQRAQFLPKLTLVPES